MLESIGIATFQRVCNIGEQEGKTNTLKHVWPPLPVVLFPLWPNAGKKVRRTKVHFRLRNTLTLLISILLSILLLWEEVDCDYSCILTFLLYLESSIVRRSEFSIIYFCIVLVQNSIYIRLKLMFWLRLILSRFYSSN